MIQNLARKVIEMMETNKRTNGDEYISLKTERPDWMQDLCRSAHGDFLPDDLRYKMIYEVLSTIADSDKNADLDEVMLEQIEADIFTNDLTYWLSSRTDRSAYVNDAVADGMISLDKFNIIDAISAGQLAEKREVFSLVKSYLFKIDNEALNG